MIFMTTEVEPAALTAKTLKDFFKLGDNVQIGKQNAASQAKAANKDNLGNLARIVAHILLLLVSEFDSKLVRLKTDKSDLNDKQWVTGMKPALSNCSKMLALIKQVRFTATMSPK